MADIFAELDDAMRHERMAKLWKEHGKTFLAVIALLIVGTAISSAYRHWNASVKASQTDQLMTLMDDSAFPENLNDADLDLRPGLRGIALLTGGGALMEEKKSEEALALYERAASDNAIPQDLRHLAVLMSVRLKASQENADAADLQKRLRQIWSDKNSPWRYHAYMDSAALYADKEKNYEAARKQLDMISGTKDLAESLYAKAAALDHVYALKQQQKTEKETNEQTQ